MKHSTLAPSSADRRMQCPGSRHMELQFPQGSSPQSIEGVLAHEVAKAIALGERVPFGATEEMIEGGNIWKSITDKFPKDKLNLEQTIDCSSIHPECFGTPDLWAFDGTVLTVADYKFGHREVPVFMNWQLLMYTCGLWGSGIEPSTIDLIIVQPRNFSKQVSNWTFSASELPIYNDLLVNNCIESMSDRAYTATGPKCRDCKARHSCKTLHNSSSAILDMIGDNVPFDLPDQFLGNELSFLKKASIILDARISGLENEIISKIKLGSKIAGWHVQQSRGRERWSKDDEEIITLGKMLGVDVSKPGLITPKQAIKKGLSKDVVSNYTEVPMGELKLVPDDTTVFQFQLT